MSVTTLVAAAPAAPTPLPAATAHPHFPTADLVLQTLHGAGLLAREAVEQAAAVARETGLHVTTALLRLNAIAELPLYRHYARLLDLPLLQHESDEAGMLAPQFQAAAQTLRLAPPWFALKGLLALQRQDHVLVAFREEVNSSTLALLTRRCAAAALPMQLAVATPTLVQRVHSSRNEAEPFAVADDLRLLRELAEEGPTIELVNSLLSQAVTQRASDIHFEPEEFDFAVRLRVDGQLQELARHPRDRYDAVVCRVKILSGLDIAERRLPQDGRINGRVHGESFDMRVSVLPGSLGEAMVLRLLRQDRKPQALQDLGMSEPQAELLRRWTQLSNGIVLVTGPTGSGKSTTLYTALELANDRRRKIITIEDPVEYRIKGITQLQVNAEIGYTFATALRSILRHDPDMILVGEIRDEETARIAIQSALTGHMVLSTLHTNSAIGAITRLVDMGLEPFLIAASVRGLMAQRLVRHLCTHCAEPDTAADAALQALLERFALQAQAQPRRAVGCAHCAHTGYFGRQAIYDLIELNPEFGHQIAQGASEGQLLAMLGPLAGQGLLRSGVMQIALGHTTLSEVIRATAGAQ